MKRLTPPRQQRRKAPLILALIGGVLLILALGTALALRRGSHDGSNASQTTSPTTAGQDTKGESNVPSDTPIDAVDDKGDSSSTDPNTPLQEPIGTFVSNHHPNLDSAPAPNSLESVCNTTPGATCTIAFTKDGVTKTLPPQTTDRGGATYWSWTLQTIGLTEGSWHVQARATLGSQTKTADDALTLEVGP